MIQDCFILCKKDLKFWRMTHENLTSSQTRRNAHHVALEHNGAEPSCQTLHQHAITTPCNNCNGCVSGCVFCTCASLTASFGFASLPGHESLQHGHVLLGEVVLSHHVFQRLQVTRNHQHRLHLVFALDGAQDERDVNHVTWRDRLRTLTERIGILRHKRTLMSPSSTSRDETKLYPWKEGVAKAFLRRASAKNSVGSACKQREQR